MYDFDLATFMGATLPLTTVSATTGPERAAYLFNPHGVAVGLVTVIHCEAN